MTEFGQVRRGGAWDAEKGKWVGAFIDRRVMVIARNDNRITVIVLADGERAVGSIIETVGDSTWPLVEED